MTELGVFSISDVSQLYTRHLVRTSEMWAAALLRWALVTSVAQAKTSDNQAAVSTVWSWVCCSRWYGLWQLKIIEGTSTESIFFFYLPWCNPCILPWMKMLATIPASCFWQQKHVNMFAMWKVKMTWKGLWQVLINLQRTGSWICSPLPLHPSFRSSTMNIGSLFNCPTHNVTILVRSVSDTLAACFHVARRSWRCHHAERWQDGVRD